MILAKKCRLRLRRDQFVGRILVSVIYRCCGRGSHLLLEDVAHQVVAYIVGLDPVLISSGSFFSRGTVPVIDVIGVSCKSRTFIGRMRAW